MVRNSAAFQKSVPSTHMETHKHPQSQDLIPSSGLFNHCMQMVCRYVTCRQKPTHKISHNNSIYKITMCLGKYIESGKCQHQEYIHL